MGKFIEKAEWWLPKARGQGNEELMGTKFQFGMIKKF